MTIKDDRYIDFSLSQQETQIHPSVAEKIQPKLKLPTIPSSQKKTHLEHFALYGATSTVMRAIRKTRVECLHEYFEQTCDWRPYETAVFCGSSRLTYQELDQRANQLAHLLLSRGVGRGEAVGVLLDRSLETYIALLGVLKAGAAFVPLDPSSPSDLVAFIAKDTGLQCLVTTSAFHEKTSVLPCYLLELDREYEALAAQYQTRPQVQIAPASLCYIIYTSGTTGQPQGIAVSHASIVNFLRVATPIYHVTHKDRVYQGVSTALDFSFEEIWPTWIVGATLVADPAASQRSGHALTEFLIDYNITVLCCVPALLAAIEREVPSLRIIIIGGALCPDYLVSRWARPGRRMLNTYGTPETTVAATWCELFPNRPVTLGSPLPTYYTYILDHQLRPVEDGKSGEIYIGGPGVAIGYVNRPDLTRERFIPNPVWRDREVVPLLFRTGDLGRITPAGEIEYLRHIDIPAKSYSDYIEYSETRKLAIPPASLAPFSEYASVSQSVDKAIFEAETSELKIAKRMSISNVYKLIMTDPLYRNSLFNMASTFILGGLGFVFWIIIARLYKPENVGVATTLISLMTLLSSFTVLGLHSSLNRYLPKSTNKNELINSSFIIVAGATIVTCILFLLGLQTFSPQLLFLQSNPLYIVSFTVFVIFCSWNVLVESVFMAFRAAGNILIKNSTISILKLMLPFALITLGAYGIFASAASAFALGVLLSLIILLLQFKIKPSLSVNISLLKETLGYSFANYMAGFMLNMPSLVLPVIILNAISAKYAAYYYIASMVQSILQIIPLATAQSLLTEGAYNEAGLKKHVKKAFTTVLVILIPATLVIVFCGKILLGFFGKSYASEALPFLQLYSISTIFTALLLISNAIMNVKHQIKSLIFANILSSVLTLWLSYAFISGKLVGIGWGWTLGQAIAGLISVFFIIRNVYF